MDAAVVTSLSLTRSVTSTSPSSRNLLSTTLHVVALASLTNSFRLLFAPGPVTDFMTSQYGGHFTFLTVLGLGVSWTTFVVALMKDVFPSSQALGLSKTALTIIVVPAEGIITVLYWGMYFIDPTLLVPADSKFQIPLSLDIGLHALPALFLWLDFLLFSPRMSKQANPLVMSAFTVLGYVSWMEHTSAVNQRFPYPFLNELPPAQRSAFYITCIPLLVGLFHLANGVHLIVRGDEVTVQTVVVEDAQLVKKDA